jgi:hypothetical protein
MPPTRGWHLAMWDPNWLVLVRQLDLVKRHEGRPRDPAHRVEHPRVGYAGPPGRRHELLQSLDLVDAWRIVHRRHSSILTRLDGERMPRIPPAQLSFDDPTMS